MSPEQQMCSASLHVMDEQDGFWGINIYVYCLMYNIKIHIYSWIIFISVQWLKVTEKEEVQNLTSLHVMDEQDGLWGGEIE